MEIKRGDIVYLYDNAYLKADGNIEGNPRPLIVISNDIGNKASGICIVVPLTTSRKRFDLPTHTSINMGASVVLCEQIFTVNQKDIRRIVGHASNEEIARINNCLLCSLGLDRG